MNTVLLREGLVLVALCSLVPLGISAITGLCVSLIQAATQIQEQTTPYIVKLLSFSCVVFLFGHLASYKLIAFTQQVFKELSAWRY